MYEVVLGTDERGRCVQHEGEGGMRIFFFFQAEDGIRDRDG